ncbi:hypothetical protein F7725_011238, partial [Dissostichus mawsoni]
MDRAQRRGEVNLLLVHSETGLLLNGPFKQNGAAVMGSSSITPSRSVIRSPVVEESSQLTTSTHPPPSPPLPPPVLPAAVRGPSQPPSSPTSAPLSPDRIHTTHVLTHLIEGFVIREGLEPFPVISSSMLAEQQASLPESQERQTNGDLAAEDSPLDADQSDSTDSEMEEDDPAADERGGSAAAMLQCEFCGGRGHAHTFLRSKRFCSMTCVRRFSVSCTKRVTVQRVGRWGHRPTGRRGRPPGSRVNGASREHFLRQARRSFEETRQSSLRDEEEQEEEEEEEEDEDEPPIPMTTRLRKQTERQREREREKGREKGREEEREDERMTETISVSEEEDVGSASQWNDVAEEFRSQEIDGQALLLLTEEHLLSTMNLNWDLHSN